MFFTFLSDRNRQTQRWVSWVPATGYPLIDFYPTPDSQGLEINSDESENTRLAPANTRVNFYYVSIYFPQFSPFISQEEPFPNLPHRPRRIDLPLWDLAAKHLAPLADH